MFQCSRCFKSSKSQNHLLCTKRMAYYFLMTSGTCAVVDGLIGLDFLVRIVVNYWSVLVRVLSGVLRALEVRRHCNVHGCM